jgi:trehalose-6-phosphatase
LEDLREIALDHRNTLIIFSNQSADVLEEHFSEVDNIWLVAESGYLYKMGDKAEWKKLI